MPDREIEKIFVVSTAHITKKDSEQLTKDGFTSTDFPVRVTKNKTLLSPVLNVTQMYEYGFIIYVGFNDKEPEPWEDNEEFNSLYSEAIKELLIMAKKLGCEYLKVDRDGTEYEDLQHYEW